MPDSGSGERGEVGEDEESAWKRGRVEGGAWRTRVFIIETRLHRWTLARSVPRLSQLHMKLLVCRETREDVSCFYSDGKMEHLLATTHLHLINVQVEESENVTTQIFVALLTSQSFWISFFHSSLSWVFDCVPPPSLVSVISSGVYETSDVSLMVRRALYIFNLLPPLYIRCILLLSRQHQHFKSHCGADKKSCPVHFSLTRSLALHHSFTANSVNVAWEEVWRLRYLHYITSHGDYYSVWVQITGRTICTHISHRLDAAAFSNQLNVI